MRQHGTSGRCLSADLQLTTELLHVLAGAPDGMSLVKLCKQVGVRMSVLLRTLAWLGTANLDGQPGPGWVRVEDRGERQFAVLTPMGVAEYARRAAAQVLRDG